jgi:hypothetical protein
MMRASFAALVLTFVIASIISRGALGDRERGATRSPDYSWAEMAGIYQEERRLDEAVDRLPLFRESMRQSREELLAGFLQLDEAALQVEKAAQAHNPAFLQAISHILPGRPNREKLAFVLLSHLEFDADQNLLNSEEKARVAELGQEFDCRSTALQSPVQ